ncbi:MAG: hypothetical protein ABI835_19565 [Chloroflexota bacterium]
MNTGYTQSAQPPRRRRSSLLTLTCGCLATFAVLLVIVIVGGVLLLPQIISRVTGLTPQGDTSAVFDQVIVQPTPVLQNPTEPQQVTVDLGAFGQQTITNNNPQLYDFTLGTGAGGEQVVTAGFTEAGLMQLCQHRSTICTPNSTDPRFRNARIDLKPGGAVVYVDASLPQLGNVTLPAGIVLRWDASAHRVTVAGVDLGGVLYAPNAQELPQALGETVAAVEQQMNDLIRELAVEAGGGRFTLSDVIADEVSMTIVLR